MRIITNDYVQSTPPRGVYQRNLYRATAVKLDVSPSTFSRLIKGETDVSPVMALKLFKAFGRSPESWMMMQAEHELWKARKKVNLDRVSVIYSTLHA